MGTTPFVFDYDSWVATFPDLQAITEAAALNYFQMATLYVRNDGRGPVNDPNVQATLLNLTTAHIAKMLSPQTAGVPTTGGAEPSSAIVGRIASATEGSVTVQAEMPEQPASAAWWNQTQYGAMAWKMMAPFRTMRYVPARRRSYNPPARYWGWGI
jgi:1,6-anhydro-N-acetylmuramate kinase